MSMDEIAELADRLQAKQRRGEDPGAVFEIEWGALTWEERHELLALLNERIAHGKEVLEALDEDNRVLLALATLVALSDAPPGTTLGEALTAGFVGVMDVVETIRADPLAEQKP